MRLTDQCYVAARLLLALRSQWWSEARIRAWQGQALVDMMRHALRAVPYYRRLGIAADSIAAPEDLVRFPILSKRDLQQDPEAFLAAGFDRGALHASLTSGSSGQPTTTYFAREAWLLSKYALKMRRVVATDGLPIGRRVLIVSEQTPEQLEGAAASAPSGLGLFFRRHLLSIHSPVEQHIAAVIRIRPDIFYAYPSYLLDLISAADRTSARLPRVPSLYTSSEVLTPAARGRIEAAFGGRLYDVYGSTEFKEVAWQCRHGRYHLNFESVYVEPQAAGQSAPLVLSSLCNLAMPLLRFDIGDRGHFGTGTCACGRSSPHLCALAGREGEMIALPSGRRLSPYLLTTLIETQRSIRQYRIFQTAPAAFRIDVVVERPGASAAWQPSLCAQLSQLAGEPVAFEVCERESLARDPSGKRSVFARALPTAG
jgi:phenylacetate-CoA ligase